MMRVLPLVCMLAAVLIWSAIGAPARPEEPPSALSAAPPLRLTSYFVEPNWGANGDRRQLTLQVRVVLESPPGDWVQVSIRVPDGYRSGDIAAGEWRAFYFLTYSSRADFDIGLEPTGDCESTVSFPVLVQTRGRQVWLRIYIRGTARGYAAAIVHVDQSGNSVWFPPRDLSAADRANSGSYWYFVTSVSDSLDFISDVLHLDLHTPAYFTTWCGLGTRPDGLEQLLRDVAYYGGCEVKKLGDSEYAIDLADGYVGAPDSSWFVISRGGAVRLHAEEASAADVIPVLVRAIGLTMTDSPDLAGVTIGCDMVSTPRGVLEFACDGASPAITYAEQDGVFSFTLREER